jgi:hypothetical protein
VDDPILNFQLMLKNYLTYQGFASVRVPNVLYTEDQFIDFTKAFDTVRQAALVEKLALINIPDNVYNWLRITSLHTWYTDMHCRRQLLTLFRTMTIGLLSRVSSREI